MSLAVSNILPESLVRTLRSRESANGKAALIGDQERSVAISWLRRILVDFRAMSKHLRLLEELYGAAFSIPTPRRDRWIAENELTYSPAFVNCDVLADATISEIADSGVEALSNEQIGPLLLNPAAICDLHDAIDELMPEAWMPILDVVSRDSETTRRVVEISKDEPVRRGQPTLAQKASCESPTTKQAVHLLPTRDTLSLVLGTLAVAASLASLAVGWSVLSGQAEMRTALSQSIDAKPLAPSAVSPKDSVALNAAVGANADWKNFEAYLSDDTNEDNLESIRGAASKAQIAELDRYARLGLTPAETIRCLRRVIIEQDDCDSARDSLPPTQRARFESLVKAGLNPREALWSLQATP